MLSILFNEHVHQKYGNQREANRMPPNLLRDRKWPEGTSRDVEVEFILLRMKHGKTPASIALVLIAYGTPRIICY